MFLVSFLSLVSCRQQVYLSRGALFFLSVNVINGKCQLNGLKKQDILFSDRDLSGVVSGLS